MKKEFVIKSLKNTFAGKPLYEIHTSKCKHLLKNVSQISKPLISNSAEDILVEYVDNDNGCREDYILAPCTR